MRFEWDPQKSQANKAKHGVSFDLAKFVFADPHVVSLQDDCETEERWLTLGLINGVLILAVVHTSEDQHNEEIIRIISARKATPREREEYDNRYRKN
jgi:uncharacterized DUF497 family protein